jgi:hypothetical protein
MATLLKYVAVLAALLACAAAQAAEQLEVSVAGRIAAANSCVPMLSGGELDYGVIKASSLNRDGATFLPEKTLSLRIDCQFPVNRFVVGIPDHKSDDAVRETAVIQHPECAGPHCGELAFGLGRDQHDRKIGALFLRDRGATLDGRPANWLATGKQPDAQATAGTGAFFYPRHGAGGAITEYSPTIKNCVWSPDEDNPHCFVGKQFGMQLSVAPAIDSKDREVSDDIRLNGALTIEIRML